MEDRRENPRSGSGDLITPPSSPPRPRAKNLKSGLELTRPEWRDILWLPSSSASATRRKDEKEHRTAEQLLHGHTSSLLPHHNLPPRLPESEPETSPSHTVSVPNDTQNGTHQHHQRTSSSTSTSSTSSSTSTSSQLSIFSHASTLSSVSACTSTTSTTASPPFYTSADLATICHLLASGLVYGTYNLGRGRRGAISGPSGGYHMRSGVEDEGDGGRVEEGREGSSKRVRDRE